MLPFCTNSTAYFCLTPVSPCFYTQESTAFLPSLLCFTQETLSKTAHADLCISCMNGRPCKKNNFVKSNCFENDSAHLQALCVAAAVRFCISSVLSMRSLWNAVFRSISFFTFKSLLLSSGVGLCWCCVCCLALHAGDSFKSSTS